MYFTKSQIRALWFIVIVFGAAVLVHYVKVWFFTDEAYDFSAFEEVFEQKRDSILQAENQMKSQKADVSQSATSQKNHSSVSGQFPIDINLATATQLQLLPRIGPKISQRIIDFREKNGSFKTKKDLTKVKGIGEKTFQRLSDLITVSQ